MINTDEYKSYQMDSLHVLCASSARRHFAASAAMSADADGCSAVVRRTDDGIGKLARFQRPTEKVRDLSDKHLTRSLARSRDMGTGRQEARGREDGERKVEGVILALDVPSQGNGGHLRASHIDLKEWDLFPANVLTGHGRRREGESGGRARSSKQTCRRRS